MSERTIEEVVHAIGERFKSGNGVPVERVMVTRTEWQAVCDELDALAKELDAIEDRIFDSECRMRESE